MRYYTTSKKAPPVDFFSALMTGQAPDRGLYMPEKIPNLSRQTIKEMASLDYPGIAFQILKLFLAGICCNDLMRLCRSAYTFQPRLEKVTESKYLMWLDTGPTASFKDFAAQMMARLMEYKLGAKSKLLILTATSGDTGSAIAHAFYRIPGIDVVILFPLLEVSDNQRKQMTTLGGNIRPVAIRGKFDDAQAMVKEAFADQSLRSCNLTSANSINIGRLIPQIIYYFWAYVQVMKKTDDPVIFSVPSGNFGNMMGAVFAWKMGLPVKKLVIATNSNDEFPEFLRTGVYRKIEPSRKCISNAMNVGHPSNLARLVDVFGGTLDERGTIITAPEMEKMRQLIYSVPVSDDLTRQTIKVVYEKYRVVLEPHGAVGWYGLTRYLEEFPEDAEQCCISLETASPAKFPEEIARILGIVPETPPCLSGLDKLDEHYETMDADYITFHRFLKRNYSS